jgi:flagellar brake protein
MTNSPTTTEPKEATPTSIAKPTSSEIEKFGIRSSAEVIAILQAIVKTGDFVSVYCNENQDFLLTTLLAVDSKAGKLYLDLGANQIMNRRAGEAATVTCVTTHDKIKVQFDLKKLSTTTYDKRPAFVSAVPSSLLRFQRRAYYRLQVPSTPPVPALINVQLADGTIASVDAKLNDISIGGVNLTVPVNTCDCTVGEQFKDCRIELPDVGSLKTTLVLRNRDDRPLRSGSMSRRLGCEFLRLSSSEEALIQRYIFVTDRGQAARKQTLRR